jgi:hypothetical protein
MRRSTVLSLPIQLVFPDLRPTALTLNSNDEGEKKIFFGIVTRSRFRKHFTPVSYDRSKNCNKHLIHACLRGACIIKLFTAVIYGFS